MKSCPCGSPKDSTPEQPSRLQRFKMPVSPRLSRTTNLVGAGWVVAACPGLLPARKNRSRKKNPVKTARLPLIFATCLSIIEPPLTRPCLLVLDRVYAKVEIRNTYSGNSQGVTDGPYGLNLSPCVSSR